MAPLNRLRPDDKCMPHSIMTDYHSQRASGHSNILDLWDPVQLKAWKEVTDVVHTTGSNIFEQLWVLGRTADPIQLRKEGFGNLVSCSAVLATEWLPRRGK